LKRTILRSSCIELARSHTPASETDVHDQTLFSCQGTIPAGTPQRAKRLRGDTPQPEEAADTKLRPAGLGQQREIC